MAEDVGSPLVEVPGLGNVSVIAEDVCLGNKEAGIDVLGLVAIIIFYLAVLAVMASNRIIQRNVKIFNFTILGWNLGKLENQESGTKSRTGRQ